MIIMDQKERDPRNRAEGFLNDDVKDVDEAIAGACDIIAEWISEDEKARRQLRRLFEKEAVIFSKVVKKRERIGRYKIQRLLRLVGTIEKMSFAQVTCHEKGERMKDFSALQSNRMKKMHLIY